MPARSRGRRLGVAAVSSLAVLATAAPASAATRDVCPSGCTYATPQAAVDAAATGDLVTIAPGTYPALRFGSSFTTDDLTIRGVGDERPVLSGGIEFANDTGNEIAGMTIENVVVRGTTAGDPTAVIGMRGSAGGTRDFTLRDSLVDGQDDRTGGFGGRNLFFARNMTGDVVLEGNELTRGRGWCVFDTGCNGGSLRFPDSIVFTDNVVHDNDGWVALRGKSPAEPIPSVELSDNLVVDMGPTAVSAGAAVKAFNVAALDATGNWFDEIRPTGTHPAGEAVYGAALAVKAVGTMEVTDNVFQRSAQGLALDSGATAMPTGVVSGNTFSDNGYAIYVPASANVAGGATITANAIVGSTVEQIHHGGTGTLSAPRNWWGCNAGPGAAGCGSVTGDVAVGPRVVLALGASAGQVTAGTPVALTASVARDSSGDPVAGLPDQDIALSASSGALSSGGGTTTDGALGASFSSYVIGTATIAATLDGQTVTVPVSVIAPPEPATPAPAPQPEPQPQQSAPSTNPPTPQPTATAPPRAEAAAELGTRVRRSAGFHLGGAEVFVPAAGGGADRPASTPVVTGRTVRLDRGSVRDRDAQRLLAVACPEGACTVRAALTVDYDDADGRRRSLELRGQRLDVAAGEAGVVALTLPGDARRALLAGRRVRLTVAITVVDADGASRTSRQTFTLQAPKG